MVNVSKALLANKDAKKLTREKFVLDFKLKDKFLQFVTQLANKNYTTTKEDLLFLNDEVIHSYFPVNGGIVFLMDRDRYLDNTCLTEKEILYLSYDFCPLFDPMQSLPFDDLTIQKILDEIDIQNTFYDDDGVPVTYRLSNKPDVIMFYIPEYAIH